MNKSKQEFRVIFNVKLGTVLTLYLFISEVKMKEGFKVFQDKTGKIHFGTNKNKKGRGKAKTKGKNVMVKQEGKTEEQEPEEPIPRV